MQIKDSNSAYNLPRWADLHKITLTDNNKKNICPCCEYAEETVSHFLGQCPAHSLSRGDILNTFYLSHK
jgi:hypothetical protein